MLKIEWHSKSEKISQIPKEGIEFAWVSEDYQQIHQLVWCKDFLQDVLFGHLNSQPTSIYRFNYNPINDPKPYMQKCRMIIANWKDSNFKQKVFENLKPFINSIESKLKMQKTTFVECDDVPKLYKKTGVILIEGDPRWMVAPPMISMYTLLLRVGMMHSTNKTFGMTLRGVRDGNIPPYYPTPSASETDKQLLKSCYKSIQKIIKEGDRKIFGTEISKNYPKFTKNGQPTSIHLIHECCGLKSYATEITKKYFPEWHGV